MLLGCDSAGAAAWESRSTPFCHNASTAGAYTGCALQEMVQATSALSNISTAGYLAVFLTIFSLIAFDVTSPASSHILQPVDLAVHSNVVQNVPLDFRLFTADKVISNRPIGMGALFSIAGLQLIISKNLKKGLFLGGLLGAFNVLCTLRRPT